VLPTLYVSLTRLAQRLGIGVSEPDEANGLAGQPAVEGL